MLTIAPDLMEAMLEIVQKTRWLQTALAIVEFQQMVIQAIFVRVRCVALRRRRTVTDGRTDGRTSLLQFAYCVLCVYGNGHAMRGCVLVLWGLLGRWCLCLVWL
jgi:hypothetical protein